MASSGRWAARIMLSALFSSCGGGGEGGGIPIPVPIALDELGSRMTAAHCAHDVRCGIYSDQAACEGANPTDMGRIMADVQAGKMVYDGAKAAECLSPVASAGCTFSDEAAFGSQACDDMFKGTLGVGETCYYHDECASGDCLKACGAGTACCPGTCQPGFTISPTGGPCGPGGPVCAAGSYCQPDLITWRFSCGPRVALGGRCEEHVTGCVAGTACQDDVFTGDSSCLPVPEEGEPCDPREAHCDQVGDYCDTVSGKCAPMLPVGAACSKGVCVPYARCDLATMTCVALAALGAPCVDTGGCLAGLTCVKGVCAAPPPEPLCP